MAGLLLAALLTASFSAFAVTCDDIRADTLRLHVVANSDSAADQSLKLDVRDAVLQKTGALFGQAATKAQALETAKNSKTDIAAAARELMDTEGYSYPVSVSVVRMWFPTTRYRRPEGVVTLPAGEYDAVQVVIGAGAGHNWFCVLFPQLCLPAAEPKDAKEIYTASEQHVLESKYEVKFAVLEWLESGRIGEDEEPAAQSESSAESSSASLAGPDADGDPAAQQAAGTEARQAESPSSASAAQSEENGAGKSGKTGGHSAASSSTDR